MGEWERLINEYVGQSPFSRQAKTNASVARRFFERHDSLSVADLQAFLNQARADGASAKTICNYRAGLSRFCRYLKDHGHLAVNPCKLLEVEHPEEPMPLVLSDAEVERALELARAEGIHAQACVALYAGLRVGEIRRLARRDVDLAARILRVKKSKGKRPRTVSICEPLAAVLADHLAALDADKHLRRCRCLFPGRDRDGRAVDRPYSEWWYIDKISCLSVLPTIAELPAGRTGRGWHALRHTFASRAVRAKVNIYDVSRWLGHKHVTTTQRYAHLFEGYSPDIERASGAGHADPKPAAAGGELRETLGQVLDQLRSLGDRLSRIEKLWS